MSYKVPKNTVSPLRTCPSHSGGGVGSPTPHSLSEVAVGYPDKQICWVPYFLLDTPMALSQGDSLIAIRKCIMDDLRCISRSDIDNMKKVPRLKLVNGLSGFKSANLLGTQHKDGTENLAVFSSVVHLGSNPPLLGYILRPNTVPRHTWDNITAEGWYTVNHVNRNIYKQAHQTSGKYREDISEFEECQLTPWYSKRCKAPYVDESNIKIGLKPVEHHLIEANQTTLLVGSIEEVWLDEAFIESDGSLNIEKAQTVTISGVDSYHKTEILNKMNYVRIEKEKSRRMIEKSPSKLLQDQPGSRF